MGVESRMGPGLPYGRAPLLSQRTRVILIQALFVLAGGLCLANSCVLSCVLFSSLPIAHGARSLVLQCCELLTGKSLCLAFIGSFAWVWYVGLIVGPRHNNFAMRFQPRSR